MFFCFTGDAYIRQDRAVATGPEFPHRVRGPKGGRGQTKMLWKGKNCEVTNLKTNSQNPPKIIFRSDVLDEKDQNGPTLATSSGQFDQEKARPRRTAS